jgi:hypothetical protein
MYSRSHDHVSRSCAMRGDAPSNSQASNYKFPLTHFSPRFGSRCRRISASRLPPELERHDTFEIQVKPVKFQNLLDDTNETEPETRGETRASHYVISFGENHMALRSNGERANGKCESKAY